MLNLNKKNILVTGASSGIGQEIAIMAAKIGANVTLLGRNEDNLKKTLNLLQGKQHCYFCIDLTNTSSLDVLFSEHLIFDGIVFNAGVADYLPVKFLNSEKIATVFKTNFEANVILSQKLIKNKLLNKKASLVFISSIASKLGVSGTSMYAASKGALNAFSKVLASELAPQGIRCNSICPGIIQTAMTEKANEAVSKEEMQKAANEYPLGYGKPEDVAGLVMYLLSDLSKWMTGSELVIDGGFTLK